MKILPKTMQEAIPLVYDILIQGDSRYNDPEREIILSEFLVKEAIDLEEREIPKLDIPKEDEEIFKYQSNVQWGQKIIAKALLKLEGFQDSEIFFERRFRGSQPDIMTEKEGKLILVECCSCRVSKIIDFLEEADEIWIITSGQNPHEKIQYLNSKMQWFVFKKGKNWDDVFSQHQKKRYAELKKIKNPYDILMGV